MNARKFFAELKRRNVSESRADDLAGRTEQRMPDWLGLGGSASPKTMPQEIAEGATSATKPDYCQRLKTTRSTTSIS